MDKLERGVLMDLAEKILRLLLDLYADQEHIKIDYEIIKKDDKAS